MIRAAALAIVLLAAAFGAAADESWPAVPLPQLPDGVIELRVAYAVNPRLPQIAPERIPALLDETARVVRAHFGITVAFRLVETVDVAGLFAGFSPAARAYLDGFVYDDRGGTGDRARLVDAYVGALPAVAAKLDPIFDFAAPYLIAPPPSHDRIGLARALTDTHLARLARLRALPAPDGRPTLDASPANEWIYWNSLGYRSAGWDVIVTNQLVASVEYAAPAVHVALRGGIDVGGTDYSKTARFGAFSWLSTFPFTSESPDIVMLRGGARYDADRAVRLAGAYLAHEIGHALFHFDHPWGNPSCVMTPARLLRFDDWLSGLDAQTCAVGSAPAMRPGALKLRIDPTRAKLMG